LTVYLTGPNSDYAFPGQTAGYVSETALTAAGDGNGTYWWTFSKTLPATAKGSWTVAIEGRRDVTLYPGTAQQQVGVRNTAFDQQMTFSVDGSKPVPRRQIVSTDKCNVCHGAIAFHGDIRNDVDQCVICHNPNMTASGGTGVPANTIDFPVFIHRIHRGDALTRQYTVSSTNFNGIGFPGDLRNCDACHINNSQQLPVGAVLPVTDPGGYMTSVPPTTAACTGCHDTMPATAHAAANIAAQGEACASCHGNSGDFSVDKVHAH
jgi:OmcA/MtrC family decaheme c-type cytochrome